MLPPLSLLLVYGTLRTLDSGTGPTMKVDEDNAALFGDSPACNPASLFLSGLRSHTDGGVLQA